MQTRQTPLNRHWPRKEMASVAAFLFYAIALGVVACGAEDNESGDRASSAFDGSTIGGAITTTNNGGTGSTANTVPFTSRSNDSGGASATGSYGGAPTMGSTKASELAPSHTGGSQNTASGSPRGGTIGAAGSSTVVHCDPLDMSGWSPPAYVPPRRAASCTATEIANYYDQCLFGSDCEAFVGSGSSSPCGTCLAPSAYSDASHGPLLLAQSAPSYIYLSNTSGCIDLMGEPACGAKIQAADSCARAACGTPCTAGGLLHFEAYQDCMIAARSTVCVEYEKAATCIVDPTHAAACRGADSSFRSLYVALADVFCR